ncbi:MAG: restriction endonuclease subunit S [Acidobacteriaceae bacterium]
MKDLLPKSWVSCTVAVVTVPVEKIDPGQLQDRPFSYVDISSIDNRTNHVTAPKQMRLSDAPSRARQLVKSGDVVFSTVRPYLRNIAQIPDALDGEIASTGFAVLRAAAGVDPKYLFYKATSNPFVSALSGEQYGVSYPAVRDEQVRAQTLELPPTNEQRRIVAKIDDLFSELDKGVEALTTAREQLKTYQQALLKHAFEGKLTEDWRARHPDRVQTPAERLRSLRAEADARFAKALDTWEATRKKQGALLKPQRHAVTGNAEIPEHLADHCTAQWAWLRLGDVSDVTGGLTKSPKRSALPLTMKYLRVANVYADHLDLDDVTEIGVTDDEFEHVRLQPGDILVVEGNGSVEQIGRVAVWGGEIPDVSHQNHLIRVRFFPDMSPRFFLSFLMSPLGRDLIVREASSTSGLHTLSISKVAGLPVPVPTAEEQEALLAALDGPMSEIEKLAEEIEAAFARCSALRQSILKQAFSGQLVAQDWRDEPASVLLDRICAEREAAEPKKERNPKNGKKKAA